MPRRSWHLPEAFLSSRTECNEAGAEGWVWRQELPAFLVFQAGHNYRDQPGCCYKGCRCHAAPPHSLSPGVGQAPTYTGTSRGHGSIWSLGNFDISGTMRTWILLIVVAVTCSWVSGGE